MSLRRLPSLAAAAARYLVLSAFLTAIVLPLVWVLSASLKPDAEVFTIPVRWLPSHPRWGNYSAPFVDRPFGRYFLNSLLVTAAATAGNLFFATMAGYGLAKFRFRGVRLVFLFILSTMMLPVQVIMVPLFLIVRDLGWLNTYQGLIVPIMISAFSIFFMRQYILSIPDDYIDAARIDGASEVGILFRIVWPLSLPGVAGIGVLVAMFNWDEFLWPLLVVSEDSLRTLPLGLASFEGSYRSAYNQLMAMSILAMAPLVTCFLCAQRRFIESIGATGIKE
jgi:multiple sugar transport system permease protein